VFIELFVVFVSPEAAEEAGIASKLYQYSNARTIVL
jgi:hypothetical protein